jgi:hypothetical protein
LSPEHGGTKKRARNRDDSLPHCGLTPEESLQRFDVGFGHRLEFHRASSILLLHGLLRTRQIEVHARLTPGHIAAKTESLPRLLLLHRFKAAVYDGGAHEQLIDLGLQLIEVDCRLRRCLCGRGWLRRQCARARRARGSWSRHARCFL